MLLTHSSPQSYNLVEDTVNRRLQCSVVRARMEEIESAQIQSRASSLELRGLGEAFLRKLNPEG